MPKEKRLFIDPSGGGRKGGMEKDVDPRFVSNGYYTNARNVSYMINGNNFVLTNLKGNTSKSYTLNAGDNICIGAYDDKGLESVFYFIFNGEGSHEVLRYDYNLSNDTITKLAEGVGLGFEFNKLITGIVLVLDRYLVWAQEGQEIGCIDLDNLPAPAITTANRHLVELYKIPNPTPLRPRFASITSKKSNNLFGKLYKFRTRYIYKGGFRSHPSTISKLAFPANSGDKEENLDNVIHMNIVAPYSDQVEKVELLVQSGNDDSTMGIWYKFKELDYADLEQNDATGNIVIYTGEEPLEVVDQTEMAMPFSFIPPSCKEVVFLPSNVLAFLNITEGFDADVEVRGQAYPIYNARPTGTAVAGTTLTYSATPAAISGTFYNHNFNIVLSTSLNRKTIAVGGTPVEGDNLAIVLTISHTGTVPVSFANVVVTFQYEVTASDTVFTITERIADTINSADTRYLGFGGIVASFSTTTVSLVYGVNDLAAPYTPSSDIVSVATTITNKVTNKNRKALPNFKRWRNQYVAIQYNKNGRRSSAIPLDTFYVQGNSPSGVNGWVTARAVIENLPPADADRFDILYGKTQQNYLQLYTNTYPIIRISYSAGSGVLPLVGQEVKDITAPAVGRVVEFVEGNLDQGIVDIALESGTFTATNSITFDTTAWAATIDLVSTTTRLASDFPQIISNDRKTFGSLSEDYNFVEGDQVRLIAKFTTGPSTLTYFTDTISVTINSYNTAFLTLSYDGTILVPAITGKSTVLVEVWRPETNEQPSVYYEVAKSFVISNGFHTGDVQTQTALVGAIISLSDIGDSWSRLAPSELVDGGFSLVEAADFSPYYDSAVTAIGRPNVVTESGLDEIHRGAAVAFTQPIIPQSQTNGLSIVLGSSVQTYDDSFGSIQKAALRQNKQLVVYFEDKVGAIGILEELQKQPTSEVTYQTTALFNGISYYAYDGGIGRNPEGFATYNDVHYFPSTRNNTFCRLSSNGIQEIGDYGMTSWFNENLDVKSTFAADRKILGVFDERLQNYTVSIMGYAQATSLSGSGVQLSFTLKNSSALASLIEGVILFDGTDYYFERGVSAAAAGVDDIDIVISGTPAAQNVTAAWLRYRIDSIMFNEPSNSWVSFSDITPDFMATCGVDFVSLRDGGLWVHNTNNSYGSLYGSSVNAEVTVPFNTAPDQQKLLQTIELEANGVWTSEDVGDINIEDGNQLSQLFENYYSQYQPNEWAAAFRQDTLTPNRTNALLEGYSLRGKYGTIRLLSDSTTKAKLAAVGVQFFISESSL